MTVRIGITYPFNDSDWLGGRNYFASLLSAVAACARPDAYRFVIFAGHRTITSLPEEFPDLEVVRTEMMDRGTASWFVRKVYQRISGRDRFLAKLLRCHRIDVLTHSMPLGPNPGVRTISWLYDFQFLHLPQYWTPQQIRYAKRWSASACENCDAVVVSSQNALEDLNGFVPSGRATRHALPFVSNPVKFGKLMPVDQLRKLYNLPAIYFYLPNQFWANKNHRLAIDALKLLRDDGFEAGIVCTGKPHDGRQPDYFDDLMRYRETLGLKDFFQVLGIVPYEHTQALMAHARAVLNPSRFEGWSTSVEEAKTLHKDLLLSDIAVHREQAPRRGRFFDVDDAPALAGLMRDALQVRAEVVSPEEMEADYQRRLRLFGRKYIDLLQTVCSIRPRLR